jgi:hypothetical protein
MFLNRTRCELNRVTTRRSFTLAAMVFVCLLAIGVHRAEAQPRIIPGSPVCTECSAELSKLKERVKELEALLAQCQPAGRPPIDLSICDIFPERGRGPKTPSMVETRLVVCEEAIKLTEGCRSPLCQDVERNCEKRRSFPTRGWCIDLVETAFRCWKSASASNKEGKKICHGKNLRPQ